jgi:chemotaxis protein CheX
MPPAATSQAEEIAKRYGIEAVPDSVRRLGQLVSKPNATTEEIAKLIAQDKEFTARLLRIANPRADSEQDYGCTSVEEAMQRCGMGSVLLVAMHVPLLISVRKTFQTMIGVELKRPFCADLPIDGEHLLCEIAFTGKATGAAALRLTPTTAQQIAARVLGMPPEELQDDATIDDVIGELSNMVVGNFKSNLCDAGLNCKLSPPAITRTSDFELRSAEGGLAERIGLCGPDLNLFVDLNVNPWAE